MEFEFSEKVQRLQSQLREFIGAHVLPQCAEWEYRHKQGGASALIEPIKQKAKQEGLWNLFLPALKEDEPGTRLSNAEYAPLAEIMGRVHWGSEIFNCNPPDTGNMELLHIFANEEQRRQWLAPLLHGEIRSCFSMTEPDAASSDATNIRTVIRRDGDHYVINGRKWFTTGVLHPNCRFAIVMGVTDEEGPSHNRHSMVIVPIDTPGFEIVRNVPIMGHISAEGHCEIRYNNVRVPITNLLGKEGEGFLMAQARLGPGRIHHCMRIIGQCELALELMCERALERKAFGRHLSDYSNIKDWIAYSRVEIDQARLLVLRAAWRMDKYGNQAARVDVAAIKLVAAQLQTRVVDRAIQVFGAMGLTPDTPLAFLWTKGRAMRFVDGPDEVHLRSIARSELQRAKQSLGANAMYLQQPRG